MLVFELAPLPQSARGRVGPPSIENFGFFGFSSHDTAGLTAIDGINSRLLHCTVILLYR